MIRKSTILGIDPGTNLLGYSVITVLDGNVSLNAMGVIDLRKCSDTYVKLGRIYERVSSLIHSFHPSQMSIESPFYGKNVQSMLKLGRAQGVSIAAAITNQVQVHEYAPTKIKLALTGNGNASKEQVSTMLQKIFHLKQESLVPYLDATDALAAAYCHYLQSGSPHITSSYSNWSDFIKKNKIRLHQSKTNLKSSEE